MSQLSETAFAALIEAGCPQCHSAKLVVSAYVDAVLPLMEGEPVGSIGWIYKGEMLVDGVYDVQCARCEHHLYADDRCPRCHHAGGLTTALSSVNRFLPPLACPRCAHPEVKLITFVPARIVCEGKRVDRARTQTELLDEGFHAYRVDCKQCGKIAEHTNGCPLCAAPEPIRRRFS